MWFPISYIKIWKIFAKLNYNTFIFNERENKYWIIESYCKNYFQLRNEFNFINSNTIKKNDGFLSRYINSLIIYKFIIIYMIIDNIKFNLQYFD